MNEITRISATAKTNDAVLEVLKKALVLLEDLEKQWEDLTMFFVAVEDRVRVSLGITSIEKKCQVIDISEKGGRGQFPIEM